MAKRKAYRLPRRLQFKGSGGVVVAIALIALGVWLLSPFFAPAKALANFVSEGVKVLLGTAGIMDNPKIAARKVVNEDKSLHAWDRNYYVDYNTTFGDVGYNTLGNALYDAISFMSIDSEKVISIIKECQTQADVSALCYAYYDKSGKDLLTRLYPQSMWSWLNMQDYMYENEFMEVSNYVKALPLH